MSDSETLGRVNWKALGILIAVVVVVTVVAAAGHYVRKRSVAAKALVEGQSAVARQDWPVAARAFWRYLQSYPDNAEVLAEYAHAQARVRPLDGETIQTIIAAYRRLVRFQPDNEEAYDQLARLYAGVRDTDNLAYVARQRLARVPDDLKASVWLGHAMSIQHKSDQVRLVLQPVLDRWGRVPERHAEYIDACSLMSQVAMQSGDPDSVEQAQRWLDRAVKYSPNAPEALLNRARLRRTVAGQPRQDRQGLLAVAREDLERADSLPIEDPRQRLILSDEWMRLGEFDRAAAQLGAVADVKDATIARCFFDATDWRIALYLQSAELDLRCGRGVEAAQRADKVLSDLKDKGQRLPVLPTAVRAYVAADRLADAERCLHEYQANQHLDLSATPSEETPGLLEALVARGRGEPYRVIELLEPITARSLANPTPWRMLAEAYTQTDQTRRSIRAIRQYLSLQPDDIEMTRMLMRNYAAQQDWSLAVAAGRRVQALDPADVEARLLLLEDAINRAAAGAPAERSERLAAAWKELDSLAAEVPDKVNVWILRAAAAASAGDLERAERELEQGEAHALGGVDLARATGAPVPGRGPGGQGHCHAGEGLHPGTAVTTIVRRSRGHLAGTGRPGADPRADRQGPLHAGRRLGGRPNRCCQARCTGEAHGSGGPAGQPPGRDRHAQIAGGGGPEGCPRPHDAAGGARYSAGRFPGRTPGRPDPAGGRSSRTDLAAVGGVDVAGPTGLARPPAGDRGGPAAMPGRRSGLGGASHAAGRGPGADGQFRPRGGDLPQRAGGRCGALQVADRLLNLLQRQGRLSQAKDVLKNLDVTDMAISSRHTLVAMATGHMDEAIDQLKLRASHDPRDVQSRVLLAQLVYRQSRDVGQAMRYLYEADAIWPGSIAVTMGRVIILNSEGRWDEAAGQLGRPGGGEGLV